MDALREFGPGLWTAEGPPVRTLGISFPTRMVVVRLGDGTLWINSPVEASDSEISVLTALGPVRHLIAPTKLHVWRLLAWSARFPDAQLWGPPRTPRCYGGLRFTEMLADQPPSEWSREIDQVIFRGNAFLDEVEFFHRASGTLVMSDFFQSYPPQNGRPILNTLARLGGVGGEGGVGLDIRLSFIRRDLARASLRAILAWNFDRLIPAHGELRATGAKPAIERAFRWLRA